MSQQPDLSNAYLNEQGLKQERDALLTELIALRAELERERMRLVACGVVANANTPDSAAKQRKMHPDYWSASCGDVAKVVDREMALRAERDSARALLRDACGWLGGRNLHPNVVDLRARIDDELRKP